MKLKRASSSIEIQREARARLWDRTGVMRFSLWLLVLCVATSACRAQGVLQEERALRPVGGAPRAVAWHPDGKHLAIALFPGKDVAVWNVDERKEVARFTRATDTPTSHSNQEILFSPDGRYLISHDIKTLIHPDLKDPAWQRPLSEQTDHEMMLLGRIWDWQAGNEVGQIKGANAAKEGGISDAMCFTSDPTRLVVHRRGELAIHEVPNGRRLYGIDIFHPMEDKRLELPAWWIACDPVRPRVAVSSWVPPRMPNQNFDGYKTEPRYPILVYDISTKAQVARWVAHASQIQLLYSSDGKRLISIPKNWYTADYDSKGRPIKNTLSFVDEPVAVWDGETFRKLGQLEAPPSTVPIFREAGARMSIFYPRAIPGYSGFVGQDDTNHFRVWNYQIGKDVAAVPVPYGFHSAVSADGRRIAMLHASDVRLFRFRPERAKLTEGR